MQLKGSQTEGNLKEAFAGESQANRRYLYFANKADVEGQNDVPPCSARRRKAKPATRTVIGLSGAGRRSGHGSTDRFFTQ